MDLEIDSYKFFWNAKTNEGQLMLALLPEKESDPNVVTLLLDTPQEGTLMIDILRNEKPVYYNTDSELIHTGFEPVGEGE